MHCANVDIELQIKRAKFDKHWHLASIYNTVGIYFYSIINTCQMPVLVKFAQGVPTYMYILLIISRMYVGTPLELIVGSATDIYIYTCIMTVHACCPTEIHLHTCMGVCAWHTM